MNRYKRNLSLDVFDYSDNKLCNLYDSSIESSGQVVDVYVTKERNGWKLLSFTIPTTINTLTGIELNYRLDFLKADFKIRLHDDDGYDWYLISEPKIQHQAYSKNISVTAGHIAQLLKTKNLGLEFDDKEGNNIGSAEELLTAILEGTDWEPGNVTTFYEDEKKFGKNVEKKRSLKCSAKTGAFKMIAEMCDLFEAKPVYHGHERTVDIIPMNPFKKEEDEKLPDIDDDYDVLELRYSNNVKTMTRTQNTENMITKLYAYGSYGDKTNGLCSISELTHKEYVFTVNLQLIADKTYWLQIENNIYFTPALTINAGDTLIYSTFDPASRSYLYNETNNYAIPCFKGIKGLELDLIPEVKEVDNEIEYLLDFDYYIDTGLMTADKLNMLAEFQHNIPAITLAAKEASIAFSESYTDLVSVIGSNNFVKLAISQHTKKDGRAEYTLDIDNYKHGVIYRSDYLETKEFNQFSWTPCTGLKSNGDSKNNAASLVLIIHNTNPITWHKAYIKLIVDIDGKVYSKNTDTYGVLFAEPIRMDENPHKIVLWSKNEEVINLKKDDKVYLFATNSVTGTLGGLEVSIESMKQALANKTKRAETYYPTYFVDNIDKLKEVEVSGYAWAWVSDILSENNEVENNGILYFYWELNGDTDWHIVRDSVTAPEVHDEGDYWYQWDKNILYKYNGGWQKVDEKDVLFSDNYMGTVRSTCIEIDRLNKGFYQTYTYRDDSKDTPPDNYYFDLGFDTYVAFSTVNRADVELNEDGAYETIYSSINVPQGKSIVYVNKDLNIQIEDVDKPIKASNRDATGSIVIPEDSYGGHIMEDGGLDNEGKLKAQQGYCRSGGYITCYPNVPYKLNVAKSKNTQVFYYDAAKKFLNSSQLISLNFTTPQQCKFVKFMIRDTAENINKLNVTMTTELSGKAIVINDIIYHKLSPVAGEELTGIVSLMAKADVLMDRTFEELYPVYKLKTEEVTRYTNDFANEMGDMYREGYWQKNDYVDGDETKLYVDAIDNLKQVSKPSTSYNVDYLDLYTTDDMTENDKWPDIDINYAIHLIDELIDVNCWAFIDKINKCYDQPWKTTLTINTSLSTIAQRSFTDVMTNIANVASQIKGKQTLYDRALSLTYNGAFDANKLQGTIDANTVKITGGSSTWYTDNKGNIMFESADGKSAMTLTGNGLAISNRKDEWGDWMWRTAATGNGITADEIVTGYLSAERIEAGSITADRLSSGIGADLDITSNKSINMIVTGETPVGGVETSSITVDQNGIEVKTGGKLTLEADSTLDIKSRGQLDISAEAELNISGGTLNIDSNSIVNIESKGNIVLKTDSSRISMSPDGINMVSGSVNIGDANSHVNINKDIVDIYGGEINITAAKKEGQKEASSVNIDSESINVTGGSVNITSNGSLNIEAGGYGNIDFTLSGGSIGAGFISADTGSFDALTFGKQKINTDLFFLPFRVKLTESWPKDDTWPTDVQTPFLWIDADVTEHHELTSESQRDANYGGTTGYIAKSYGDNSARTFLNSYDILNEGNDFTASDDKWFTYNINFSIYVVYGTVTGVGSSTVSTLYFRLKRNGDNVALLQKEVDIRDLTSNKTKLINLQWTSKYNYMNGQSLKILFSYSGSCPDSVQLRPTTNRPIALTGSYQVLKQQTGLVTSGPHDVSIKWVT